MGWREGEERAEEREKTREKERQTSLELRESERGRERDRDRQGDREHYTLIMVHNGWLITRKIVGACDIVTSQLASVCHHWHTLKTKQY